ncbi:MAG: WecB/TagA/CpsF family glycosyltransferase [Treponema sp.]|nr:WecB/TagA/CpsF family glycosyltransferase [Treponema sp.]
MDTPTSRILLLKVPLDIIPPEEFPKVIDRLLLTQKRSPLPPASCDIVLLSLWDLLKARRNREYRNYVLNAALVIPISKSLVSGTRFVTGKKVYRYMPFHFVISLLSLLEPRELSLCLLGAKPQVLRVAERNIQTTFPGIKILGRYSGGLRKQEEGAVIEAIRKAAPSLLLVGKGTRGSEHWIARNGNLLSPGFRLWCSDLFEVFAEKRQRPTDTAFEKGLEGISFILQNPFKIFRIIPYLWYKVLLIFYRIF